MKFLSCIVGILSLLLFLFSDYAPADTSSPSYAPKSILFLHSYHEGIKWVDSINDGMKATLQGSGMDVDIHVEYMDTIRYTDEGYFDLLEEVYHKKYGGKKIDVILLSDNPALEFIIPRRERLFPGVPIVFCGANNFEEAQLQGQTGITGINENVDTWEIIDLALRINPDIRKFLVLNDRSATGLLLRDKLIQNISGFQDRKPEFELFDDFTVSELEARLSKLSKDDAVLVMRFPIGGPGRLASPDDYLRLLAENCPVPVYCRWSTDTDSGILGSVMADGTLQGKAAAEYAVRILNGEPVSSLPVIMKSPNVTLINYNELMRFHISEKDVPKDATVLFKPESLLYRYRYTILAVVLFVIMLLCVIAVLGVNILVRRKTEKALIESEKKLSSAVQMAHLGHWEYNTARNVFIFTDEFYAIFRTTADAVGGYTMTPEAYASRFVHPDDHSAVADELKIALETPDPRYSRRIEHRMRYADGATGYLAVRFFIEKDAQNRTVRLYGVNQDITELRTAEENVQRSEERWRMIVQTAMDGFCLVTIDGRFVEVNDAFCKIFGYGREELLRMKLSDLVVGVIKEQLDARTKQIVAKGSDRFEAQHRRKDGEIIDTEVSIQYRPVQGGILCTFMRDITEQKQIDARIQQGQKMEAMGTLAGGIAHDFNNILQPILGFCELLKDDLPSDLPQQGFVAEIMKAATRARELVNQILSFSRQESEEAKPMRLQPVITEALKLLRSSIPKTIEIQQDIDPDVGIVLADATKIYQIVMNLCTNAYHSMENTGGTIHVVLEKIRMGTYNPAFPDMVPGEYALLKVVDTGVGIPRSIINKIFDPYFTTKEKGRGTGLGLSIAQSVVKRYKGDIRIYSEPGKGTRVHVYLPVMQEKNVRPAPAEEEITYGSGEKILLVDDESTVTEIIGQMLKRLGYHVTTFSGSIEALNHFQTAFGEYDLVITDLTMPGMTGIQLAGELKKIRENIPILLCTGFSEQVHGDKFQALGICGQLTKPVIIKNLSEKVRVALLS